MNQQQRQDQLNQPHGHYIRQRDYHTMEVVITIKLHKKCILTAGEGASCIFIKLVSKFYPTCWLSTALYMFP